ncbi:MAG: universal stress protein [Bdellovibrionales bacterium]|nr:universal stress protein [Bdellovibrionales bacterium]
MGASVSYKLKNSIQGALAGGGDPATSPLYVFGPFLSLIVAAGVANVTFGASIWMAVFTVVTVSATYRYVMKWVTDGSGGSGLSEEEFGSWAVKVNAAVTVIEYTLTFLVSMAALVTFIADRVPALNSNIGFISTRTLLAIVLSIVVAFAVNRGPKVSSQFFGPATALILGFLWLMVFAVIAQRGLHLPSFNLKAFDSEHLHFTLGGFARILALMTGIEIFANLVAAYEGSAAQRSQRAFGSMIIVMGTTVVTMLVVGPAIFDLSNPLDTSKSVFTQTMDALLPPWLSYVGTLIGIAVLLSAAAAATQGIQNLALGLRARHYIPAKWGKRNQYDVPGVPAWGQVGVIIVAFMLFGTHEETYLALYAAGVFILLSMTGWSACKRFSRYFMKQKSVENFVGILVTVFSATCASFATFIIFEERFKEGAWSYFLMVPALYFFFDYYRKRLGPPPESVDVRLSITMSASQLNLSQSQNKTNYRIDKILVPLSGSINPEVAFHSALKIANKVGAEICPVSIESVDNKKGVDVAKYLASLKDQWSSDEFIINPITRKGDRATELVDLCVNGGFDLICISSSNMKSADKLIRNPFVYQIVYATTPPLLFYRPTDRWSSRSTEFKNILVPLDGSAVAEQVLPYVTAWASQYNSEITLLSIPEQQGDVEHTKKLNEYLNKIKSEYFEGVNVTCVVDGSGPARTILHYSQEGTFDLIAMVSHGRGGLDRQGYVRLGSVTETIMSESDVPLLFISAVKG